MRSGGVHSFLVSRDALYRGASFKHTDHPSRGNNGCFGYALHQALVTEQHVAPLLGSNLVLNTRDRYSLFQEYLNVVTYT